MRIPNEKSHIVSLQCFSCFRYISTTILAEDKSDYYKAIICNDCIKKAGGIGRNAIPKETYQKTMAEYYAKENDKKWEAKQLLDIVSKGVNSVLMQNPKTSLAELKTLAEGLTKIYAEILQDLKR